MTNSLEIYQNLYINLVKAKESPNCLLQIFVYDLQKIFKETSLSGKLYAFNKFPKKSIDLKTYKESTNLFSKNNELKCNLNIFKVISRNEHFGKLNSLT